jgi:hypothetical protein
MQTVGTTVNARWFRVVTEEATPVYRVRVWDAVLKKQIHRDHLSGNRGLR